MPRGQVSEIGEERKQQNGYWTVRTESGWRFKHHVIAETIILKRKLEPNEMVRFRDGNKDNYHPDNLMVIKKGSQNARKRLAQVISQLQDLHAEEAELMKQIDLEEKQS